MKDLNYYKEKIKEKRKKTKFRDFLLEVVSWYSVVYYRHENLISKFPPNFQGKKIIHFNEFEKNRDALINKSFDYDEKVSFFENYKKLFHSLEIFNFINYGGNDNSEFADMIMSSQNCYLSSAVINGCENIFYSISVKDNSANVFNSLAIWSNSENIYFSCSVVESFKIFYSKFINNSSNIWFSTNLNGCSECLMCNDLENCSYYIENTKYSKTDYLKKKDEILKNKDLFQKYYKNLDNIGKNTNSSNVSGSAFFNSENVKNGYYGYNVKNGRNLILVGGVDGNENMYDVLPGGAPTAHDFYGVMGANGNNVYCSQNIQNSSQIFYSYNCKDSSYLIGCIGLQNKSYCIFNKQYTKDQWNIEADKVFSGMEKLGTLGNFFPGNINPYYFNDTLAGLLGNFTKEEVEKKGYMWRDEKIKTDIPEGTETITVDKLVEYEGYDGNGNWKINEEIMKITIIDDKGNYYRIVKMEYDFLLKHGLPIPRLHWLDRMKLNFGL